MQVENAVSLPNKMQLDSNQTGLKSIFNKLNNHYNKNALEETI